MKVIVVITLCLCCAYGQTTLSQTGTTSAEQYKASLVKRVSVLLDRVKSTVQTLNEQNRSHLAQGILEEGQRLASLANELRTTSLGSEALKLLEDEMIRVATRVANEERWLEEEMSTQDEVLKAATALRQWVVQEVDTLQAMTNNSKALSAAQELIREDVRLEVLCQELIKAQTPQTIGAYEVEIRTIETRLFEALRLLDFHPVTALPTAPTPPPMVVSTNESKVNTI